MTVRLYDYWRSSAAYRVRIALNLKGIVYEAVDTSLLDGAHKTDAYRALNPQSFVPALEIDGLVLTQSLAIMDYLDAKVKEPPFVSSEPTARARTLAQALVIAADIHPVNNLRVLMHLKHEFGIDEERRSEWVRRWVGEGFAALETMAAGAGTFFGCDAPDMADICLVPQMYNARRFETPLDAYPTLVRIDAAAQAHPAFAAAHPDAVKPTT